MELRQECFILGKLISDATCTVVNVLRMERGQRTSSSSDTRHARLRRRRPTRPGASPPTSQAPGLAEKKDFEVDPKKATRLQLAAAPWLRPSVAYEDDASKRWKSPWTISWPVRISSTNAINLPLKRTRNGGKCCSPARRRGGQIECAGENPQRSGPLA
jgi:hypothetical protein